MNPPVGVTTYARASPPVGIAPPPPPDATTQARINPPVGVEARMQPPVGGTWTDMLLIWLQSRISIPNG